MLFNDKDATEYGRPKSRTHGFIFWGCFIGGKKGPTVFWDRANWGTIKLDSYIEHILPILKDQWSRECPNARLQQDNTPCHNSKIIREWLEANMPGAFIKWPPRSPDLNPIKMLFSIIKVWIREYYGEGDQLNNTTLKVAIAAAWEALDPNILRGLVRSMPKRLEQVIEAKGGRTYY